MMECAIWTRGPRKTEADEKGQGDNGRAISGRGAYAFRDPSVRLNEGDPRTKDKNWRLENRKR